MDSDRSTTPGTTLAGGAPVIAKAAGSRAPLALRYTFVERLAGGGTATIYRAVDRLTGLQVAVKLLSGGESPNGWRARHLLREGEVAAAVEHPALARLLERGEEQGRPYLVYEFLPGGSLRRAFHLGSLPLARFFRALAGVAQGLACLHQRGWVHGDVKPGNILFDAEGRAHLTDFGLARRDGQPAEEDGRIIASVPYASPEHLAGEPLSPASDMYSLCVVLFEGLTGRPFRPDRDTPESLGEAVRSLDAELPACLPEILRSGLARYPQARCRDAAMLASLLARCGRPAMSSRPAGRGGDRATEPPTLPRAAGRAFTIAPLLERKPGCAS
jgi:eukaryotic-like serine/threonine-protein kinase